MKPTIIDRQINLRGGVYNENNVHNFIVNSVDYKRLTAVIAELREDLADPSLPQSRRSKKETALSDRINELEELKRTVTDLAEAFNRAEVDNERVKRARELFEASRFKEADAVLKTEDIDRDVEALRQQEAMHEKKLGETREGLANRAREYVLKARLKLTGVENPLRFGEAEALFGKALETSRAPDVVFEYAKYLQKQNRFRLSEPLYVEALVIYRKLAEGNPAAYLPDVASTLNNLAILHMDTNRHKEAEAEYGEALGIRRKLAEENPAAYLPDVATTLNNLAILHMDTNRHKETEAEYGEALGIRRKLAEENPAAYLPYVAKTLNNLAILHVVTDRHKEAEAEYGEALVIYRQLAEDNPAAYLPDVATTLNNLAVLHMNTNRHKEAEAEFAEALGIRRKLAEENPAAYLPYVAITLNNLAVLHRDTNRHKEAETEYAEALEIRRKLAESGNGLSL